MGDLFTGGTQERVSEPEAEHDVLFQHHELAELLVRKHWRLRYIDHDQQTHRQLTLRQTLSVKSPAPAGLFFGCSVASLDQWDGRATAYFNRSLAYSYKRWLSRVQRQTWSDGRLFDNPQSLNSWL